MSHLLDTFDDFVDDLISSDVNLLKGELDFLNFVSLLIKIIKTTIHIFAKKKFKEFIIKPFNLFIARLLMCQLEKNHLKSF